MRSVIVQAEPLLKLMWFLSVWADCSVAVSEKRVLSGKVGSLLLIKSGVYFSFREMTVINTKVRTLLPQFTWKMSELGPYEQWIACLGKSRHSSCGEAASHRHMIFTCRVVQCVKQEEYSGFVEEIFPMRHCLHYCFHYSVQCVVFGCLCLKNVVVSCCQARHIVVKIHCIRALDFNIKKIQQTVTTSLKMCFFMWNQKTKNPQHQLSRRMKRSFWMEIDIAGLSLWPVS